MPKSCAVRLKQIEKAIASRKFHSLTIPICPALAKKLLERHVKQRRKSPSRIKKYAAQMRAGQWVEKSGDSIKFDVLGCGFDGQHRLEAICESGVTIACTIAFGCDVKSSLVTDTGKPKSPQNLLEINGYGHLGPAAGATMKQVFFGMEGGRNTLMEAMIAEYASRLEDGLKFVLKAFAGEDKRFKVSCAPVRGVIVRAYYARPKDRSKILDFCRVLGGGAVTCADEEPIRVLRDFIRSSSRSVSQSRDNTSGRIAWQYRKVEAYLDLFLRGEFISNSVKASSEEKFVIPWIDNPQSSPNGNHWFVPIKSTGLAPGAVAGAIESGTFRLEKVAQLRPGDKVVIGSSLSGVVGVVDVSDIEPKPRFRKDRHPLVALVKGHSFARGKPIDLILKKMDAYGKFKNSHAFQKEPRLLSKKDFELLVE